MLKFAIAGVVLVFGFAATSAQVFAAPQDQDCVDCPVSTKYDSEEVVQKIQSTDHSRGIKITRDVPAGRRVTEIEPKRVVGSGSYDCPECAPRRKYDSQEVVKKVRNIDHSRVINTKVVVPARTRFREHNHLVIHKNETRHVGTVQHNRIIVEKEIRYVRRIPVQTRVEFITHNYRPVERPYTVTVPVAPRYISKCSGGLFGTYGSCGHLRVRG